MAHLSNTSDSGTTEAPATQQAQGKNTIEDFPFVHPHFSG
jgi:hypothetical protein